MGTFNPRRSPAKMNRKMAHGGFISPYTENWLLQEDDCNRHDNLTRFEFVPTVYVPIVCVPILVIMCTLGNISNMCVFVPHCPAGMKKVFLMSLAISDTLAMLSTFPRYLYLGHNVLGIELADDSFLVSAFGAFTWLQYTFCYVSDGILVAFSWERLMAFRFTDQHRDIKNRRYLAMALILIILFVSAVATFGTLIWYYHWWFNHDKNGSYVQPDWVGKLVRAQQRLDIVCPILVATSLFITNIYLVVYLRRQIAQGEVLYATSNVPDHIPKQTPERQDSVTRMILRCVLLYFFTQFPYVLVNILDHVSNAPFCWFHFRNKALIEPVISTLALVNYSANFIVYVGTSEKYRHFLKSLFKKKICFPAKKPGTNNDGMSSAHIPLITLLYTEKSRQSSVSNTSSHHQPAAVTRMSGSSPFVQRKESQIAE